LSGIEYWIVILNPSINTYYKETLTQSPSKTHSNEKYFLIGGLVSFAVIFNLDMSSTKLSWAIFLNNISGNSKESYIIPLIAIGICTYIAFQAYFLPIYFEYTSGKYHWGLTKTALYLEPLSFFWDGLQGGMINCYFLKCPLCFWYDSGYHTVEGIVTALLLAFFYKKFRRVNHPVS